MKVWICAIAKMEELYIREWIEWHKNIGIDHIIIGDNNDSDYEYPLCPIIQDYIDEGYVEVVNKNDLLEIQLDFYNDIYRTYKKEFDWIGFIDIDEFVELPAYNNNIHKFLINEKFKDASAIILPWLCYGDGNHIYYEDKPVKERFDNFIKYTDTTTKYFIKSFDFISFLGSFHSPLNYITVNNYENNGLNNNEFKCYDPLGSINWKPCQSINKYGNFIITDATPNKYGNYWFTNIYNNDDYYNNAYLSHYVTKSTEEYIKYKVLRGRQQQEEGIRYSKEYYRTYNLLTSEKEKLFDSYFSKISEFHNKIYKKYNFNKLSLFYKKYK